MAPGSSPASRAGACRSGGAGRGDSVTAEEQWRWPAPARGRRCPRAGSEPERRWNDLAALALGGPHELRPAGGSAGALDHLPGRSGPRRGGGEGQARAPRRIGRRRRRGRPLLVFTRRPRFLGWRGRGRRDGRSRRRRESWSRRGGGVRLRKLGRCRRRRRWRAARLNRHAPRRHSRAPIAGRRPGGAPHQRVGARVGEPQRRHRRRRPDHAGRDAPAAGEAPEARARSVTAADRRDEAERFGQVVEQDAHVLVSSGRVVIERAKEDCLSRPSGSPAAASREERGRAGLPGGSLPI